MMPEAVMPKINNTLNHMNSTRDTVLVHTVQLSLSSKIDPTIVPNHTDQNARVMNHPVNLDNT